MAITRRRAIAIAKVEKATPPQKNSINKDEAQISKAEPIIAEAPPSEYEHVREQRIKENRERLEKLGILNLSLQLNAATPKPPRRKWQRKIHSGPPRRSSRLLGETPVSSTNIWAYIEPKKRKKYERKQQEKKTYEPKKEVEKKKYVPKKKLKKSQRRKKKKVSEIEDEDEEPKAEVYTEEHEKLLGNAQKEWTLCVDGYGPHGSRLYDPLNGKTCHQCRQKTLGLRTHCSKCHLVTGQFCGDCLYMRYGEHVVEANENPNWVCPPCRGICNCSLCRKAKGWPPTGLLYRKIKNLGFKSVAHYLIMTKRAPPSSEKAIMKPQSVKRCLPFDGMELESNDWSEMELNIDGRKSEDVGSSGKRSKEETGDDEKESVVTNAADSNEDSIGSSKTTAEEEQNLM